VFTVFLLGVLLSCEQLVIEGGIGSGEIQDTEPDADTNPGSEEEASDTDTGTDTGAATDTGAGADTESDTDDKSDDADKEDTDDEDTDDKDKDKDTDDEDTDDKTTKGVEVLVEISSDWGTGFCTNVAVTNNSTSTVLWETTYDVGGSITSLWNAQATSVDPLTHFMGEQWNDSLQAGESTSYGYCAER